MNTKIKLALLAGGLYFFAGCNDDTSSTTVETSKDSTTEHMASMQDTANKMQGMQMDNGLMPAMNAMMGKMSSVKMSGDFDCFFL